MLGERGADSERLMLMMMMIALFPPCVNDAPFSKSSIYSAFIEQGTNLFESSNGDGPA